MRGNTHSLSLMYLLMVDILERDHTYDTCIGYVGRDDTTSFGLRVADSGIPHLYLKDLSWAKQESA